ncbi:MAG: hypothetical protein R2818_10805 [Flavobacteriales bacterium]
MEDSFSYPISFNGKTRMLLDFPAALSKEEIEAQVMAKSLAWWSAKGRHLKKCHRSSSAREHCCFNGHVLGDHVFGVDPRTPTVNSTTRNRN